MKKSFIMALVLILSHGLLSAQTDPQLNEQTGTVEVQVTNINLENALIVKIGLYNESSDFPELGKETFGKHIEATESVVSHTFENIPIGTYAVAVVQDENDDGIQNKNFVGAPTEGYGFSHNVYGFFGPPDYKDVSFQVKADKVSTFTVNLE